MPKIAYQYEYQTDMKDIELTPHKRNEVERSVGWYRMRGVDGVLKARNYLRIIRLKISLSVGILQ